MKKLFSIQILILTFSILAGEKSRAQTEDNFYGNESLYIAPNTIVTFLSANIKAKSQDVVYIKSNTKLTAIEQFTNAKIVYSKRIVKHSKTQIAKKEIPVNISKHKSTPFVFPYIPIDEKGIIVILSSAALSYSPQDQKQSLGAIKNYYIPFYRAIAKDNKIAKRNCFYQSTRSLQLISTQALFSRPPNNA